MRFSLRLSRDWEIKAYGSEDKRASWIIWRLGLLSKHLISALLSSTRRPDKIFLLADTSDKEIIDSAITANESVEWLFSSGAAPFEILRLRLLSLFAGNQVVISRIDSDDTISMKYGEELLAVANASIDKRRVQNYYIVYTNGFRSDGIRIQPVYYSCSPFLSLFCPAYSGENIYSINHEDVLKFPHLSIDIPSWCQIIHGTNVSNRFFPAHPDFETSTKASYKLLFGTESDISPLHLVHFPFLR